MVAFQVFLLSSDSRVTHFALRTLTDSKNKSSGSVAPTDSMETISKLNNETFIKRVCQGCTHK
jgi:hypothetical protein